MKNQRKKAFTGPRQRRKKATPAPRNRRSHPHMSDYSRMVDKAMAPKAATSQPCAYCSETVETDDVCAYCGVACHPDGTERTQHCMSSHEVDCPDNPDSANFEGHFEGS